MLIKPKADLTDNDVTPKELFLKRRDIIKAGLAAMALGGAGALAGGREAQALVKRPGKLDALEGVIEGPYDPGEPLTPYEDVIRYNNFYEFGTGKSDPIKNSQDFVPRPWTIKVEGEVEKPGVLDIEDLLATFQLEERIYRLRCVEAWSMVVPWVGVSLKSVLDRFQPTSKAKYVAFETLYDPERMPGQRRQSLPWPYREGLRMDEALNELSILSVGHYGEVLPNQNGAPVRLVVPWKYGFKSIKSIVRIVLTEQEPPSTWNQIQGREYGFYANVNPNVDHPRWSQKTEERIGEYADGSGNFFQNLVSSLSPVRRPTLMFNGYSEQVAHLYQGMDLTKFY